eukprot:TRINITY_DN2407_c0_g4_i3.p1 TRINITY_DN2407_c0_g4~~TRINITY_DN2407_c0_g4_i3.p1  ORF type:complete len:437 (+),score=45.94 TRINITY_DN2407_c0_g4_i3:65-1375(+)
MSTTAATLKALGLTLVSLTALIGIVGFYYVKKMASSGAKDCGSSVVLKCIKEHVFTLKLEHLNLISLTPDLQKATHIKTLKLSYNHLSEHAFQENFDFSAFTSLTRLYMTDNVFTTLPNFFTTISDSLTHLSMSYNQIQSLDFSTISHIKHLQYLNLEGNQISRIVLGKSKGPTENDLITAGNHNNNNDNNNEYKQEKGNGVNLEKETDKKLKIDTEKGGNIVSLPSLIELNLSRNKIRQLPKGKKLQFPKLELLFLEDNAISCLHSDFFSNMTNICTLHLENNCLSSVPDDIHRLIHLTDLDLSNNFIDKSPSFLSSLSNLSTVNLSSNKITSFSPHTFRPLTKLNALFLSQNPIENLPEDLFHLPNLCRLEMENSLISSLPHLHHAKRLVILKISPLLSKFPYKLSDFPSLYLFDCRYNKTLTNIHPSFYNLDV